MPGGRGTLQPVREGRRKSPTLFAPSRIPIEPVAPAPVVSDRSSPEAETGLSIMQQFRQRHPPSPRPDEDPNGGGLSIMQQFRQRHPPSPRRQHRDSPAHRSPRRVELGGDDSSSTTSSSSSSGEASTVDDSSSSSSSGSSDLRSKSRKSQEQYNLEQEYFYRLQDENADLRKAIQGLEIVLRDQGFTRDGKKIVPDVEIVRLDGDRDEDGVQRSHMEMMSMTGMDPERPTVLCKYMEFKVSELQQELETMEHERDKMRGILRTMTQKVSAEEDSRIDKLRESRNQKRKLEDKLTKAITVSKTRESLLAQKLGGLESNLEKTQKQEGLLRNRILALEKELGDTTKDSTKPVREELLGKKVERLETKLESCSKKESDLKEQVTSLKVDLEWNLEESTKREESLRSRIKALETNLEYRIDEAHKQEELLRDKIHELQGSNRQPQEQPESTSNVDESLTHGDTLGDTLEDTLEDTLVDDTTNVDESLTLEEEDDDDDSESLTQEDLISNPSTRAFQEFQQSISELSMKHNKKLEEWKREESKEREEQLTAQINALETNLEWNLKETKKQEDFLRDQVTTLRASLEFNMVDFEKKEARLKEHIKDLKSKTNLNHDEVQGDDSLTLDSLIPPDDVFEQQQELEKIKNQKKKLEEYLSMVVLESTKREKNMQKIISELESGTKVSTDQEEALKAKISELETQLEEEKASDYARLDDLEKAWVVAMAKEREKQQDLAQKVEQLEGTVETNKVVHKSRQGDLMAKVDDLKNQLAATEETLAVERSKVSAAEETLVEEHAKVDAAMLPPIAKSGSHRSMQSISLRRKSTSERSGRSGSASRISSADQSDHSDSARRKPSVDRSDHSDSAKRKPSAERSDHTDSARRKSSVDHSDHSNSTRRKSSVDSDSARRKSASERSDRSGSARRKSASERSDRSDSKRRKVASERIVRLGATRRRHSSANEAIPARYLELEAELEKTRNAATGTDAENKELMELVSDLEHELESTRDIASAARVENQGISGRITALERELEISRGVGASTRSQNKTLSRKIADLEVELEESCDMAANTRIENKDLVKRCVELKKELDMERNDKSYRNRILISSQDAASSARGVNVGLANRISDLEKELEETQIAAASAEGENQDHLQRIAELEGQLKKEGNDKTNRDDIIADLQTAFEKAVAKNQTEATRILELEIDLESTRQEKFDRNKRLTKLQKDMAEIANKNDALNDTILELEGELEQERSDKFDHTKRIAELQADLEAAAQTTDPVTAPNADLGAEAKASKAEVEGLSKRLADLQAELETNTKSFNSMKAYNRTLETDQEAAQNENEQLRKQIKELTQTLEAEKFEQSDTTYADITIAQTTNNNVEAEAEAEVEAEVEKGIEEDLESARIEQERLNKFIVDLSNKLEEKKERIKRGSFTLMIPEIENDLEPERTELSNRNMVKRTKSKEIGNVRKMVITELEKEIENRETRNELSDLRTEMDETILDHEVKNEELKSQIQALETELEFGQHELDRLERVIFVIRNELKMAAEIHEPVAARNRELEEELVSSKAEVDRLGEELAGVNGELANSSKQFNNEILELKMKLKSKQSDFDHLSEFKHELEAELEERTAKVRNIEKEFESAAKTMDATYEELSVRNTQVEKELVSYKSENKYLNKFIGELQKEMEEKQSKKAVDDIPELKKMDSLKLSDHSSNDELDELIESDRVLHEQQESPESLFGPAFLQKHKSDMQIDESSSSSDEEMEETGKADDDDDLEESSSSSSEGSEKGERKRLESEIKDIEKKIEAEKAKQEALNQIVTDLEEVKKTIQGNSSEGKSSKSTGTITAQIRESEAELEALNAHIYELEADLEDLLDDMWDYERRKESDAKEHKEDLEDSDDDSDDDMRHSNSNSNSNRERLSTRILELEKEMEELEDELEDSIESNKNQRQALVLKNSELQGKLEVTIEKAKQEHFNLAVRYNALEKKLQDTIEVSRKDQQALAKHYIEKERELKQTSAKAGAEEKRLNAIIKKLEKEIKFNRGAVKNEDDLFLARLSAIMEDVNINQKDEPNGDNNAKERSQATEEVQRKKEELILAKVLKLKEEYDSTPSNTKVLNERIIELEVKLRSSQEIIDRAEKEVKDLNEKHVELEIKWKSSDDDHETAIWEAEQKMRDLINSASLERKQKNRFKEECSVRKQAVEVLRELNEKLSSQNEILESGENSGRDILVRRVAELEDEVCSLSNENDIELENMTKRVEDLQEELDISRRQNRSYSSQIDCHEQGRKDYARLCARLLVLKKELYSAQEENKTEKHLHSELREKLIDITAKNEAEKATLDDKVLKLQMKLESMRKELQYHEKGRKEYARVCARLLMLKRELHAAQEENNAKNNPNSEPTKNEAEKADLENKICTLQTKLESMRKELQYHEKGRKDYARLCSRLLVLKKELHSAKEESKKAMRDSKICKLQKQLESIRKDLQYDEKGRKDYARLCARLLIVKKELHTEKEKKKAGEADSDKMRNLQTQLESTRKELRRHEKGRKDYARLCARLLIVKKELHSATEESKNEKQLHSELQERLIESTMKNQAENANLNNKMRKLQKELDFTRKELQSTQEQNRSLAYDLKFFDSEKSRLNRSDIDYIEDDLRSTLEENDDIIRKMQSYERGTSSKSMISHTTPLKEDPKTPQSKERTVTENTYFDSDTIPSDAESDTAKSGSDADADSTMGVGGRGIATISSDSNHGSISTAKMANGITSPSFKSIDAESSSVASGGDVGCIHSLPFKSNDSSDEDDTDGRTNPQTAPTEEQSRRIVEYLAPLINRADKILGQEVPLSVVEGIQDLVAMRANQMEYENFTWEDFELLLEDVCQDFDEDAWFDIQEAFFVAWEETEIEKMGGDLSESYSDNKEESYNQ